MKMVWHSVYAALLVGAVVLALWLRVPGLKDRPLHNDEAVNTVKFDDLRVQKYFHYDPNEYHGPTLYYFTLPSAWLARQWSFAQTSEITYRSIPIAFGVGLMLLTLLLRRDLGNGATFWTMLLLAVSPAFVFYSRYYIHEMLLVFFTFGAIACGWRFVRSGQWRWACLTGAGVGLMYATKETWVLPMAAAGGAAALTALLERFWPAGGANLTFRWRPFLGGIGVMVATSVIFFSSFGVRPAGLLDAVAAYKTYFHRGSGGEGGTHDHPTGWYFETLSFYQYRKPNPAGGPWLLPATGFAASVNSWWESAARPMVDKKAAKPKGAPAFSEGAIILLAAGGLVTALALRRRRGAPGGSNPAPLPDLRLMRFLALYTALLALAYSLIPYKTPWCLLGFYHGMIVVAGCVCALVVRVIPTVVAKGLICAVVVLLAAQLAWQADLLNASWKRQGIGGRLFTARSHPYVYAHTSGDLFNLVDRVEQLAKFAPNGQPTIKVITADCWPLPFYLRPYTKTTYSTGVATDRLIDADIIITSPQLAPDVERGLLEQYHPEFAALRPQVLLQVYIRPSLWQRYLASVQR